MRKRLLYLMTSVIALGSLASCELFDDAINISFKTSYTTIDFTVNPADAGEHEFLDRVLQSDIQEQIEEHGGDIVSLDEITIYEAKLYIVTEGATLDPFEWLEVYVSTADVAETLIGSVSIDEVGLLNTSLDLTKEDLSAIIQADEYFIRIVGSLKEAIADPIDMQLKIRYQVVV